MHGSHQKQALQVTRIVCWVCRQSLESPSTMKPCSAMTAHSLAVDRFHSYWGPVFSWFTSGMSLKTRQWPFIMRESKTKTVCIVFVKTSWGHAWGFNIYPSAYSQTQKHRSSFITKNLSISMCVSTYPLFQWATWMRMFSFCFSQLW